MKRIGLILVALVSIFLTSCSPDSDDSKTTIIYVLMHEQDRDSLLVVNMLNLIPDGNRQNLVENVKDDGYSIPNDGSEDFKINLTKNSDTFEVDFTSSFKMNKLVFDQYSHPMNEEIPWNRVSAYNFTLEEDISKLEPTEDGYYVFKAIMNH